MVHWMCEWSATVRTAAPCTRRRRLFFFPLADSTLSSCAHTHTHTRTHTAALKAVLSKAVPGAKIVDMCIEGDKLMEE
jgi:hypothetical protein